MDGWGGERQPSAYRTAPYGTTSWARVPGIGLAPPDSAAARIFLQHDTGSESLRGWRTGGTNLLREMLLELEQSGRTPNPED
jgi:hypothetical protein